MPSASLPQRISEISKELKALRAKSMSPTEETTEILREGLEQLQVSLKELTVLVNGTTETERSEEAQSEHLYRTLFNNTEDGFVLVEPIFDEAGNSDDYRMLEFNNAWERQTGLKSADLIGKRIREVLPNVELVWPATFAEVARTGIARHFESYNADSGRWYDLHAFPYKKGQVGVLFRDITERKQAEEKLRENEERFRAVQESSLDRFTILKPFYDDQGEIIDFTYVYQNAQAARTAGRRPEELIGLRMTEIWPTFPQTRFFAMYKLAVETRQVIEFEDRYNAEGVDEWFSAKVTPIPDGIAVATQIITERKKMEEALKRSEALYRAIAKHLPYAGVYVFDQDLRFLVVEGQGSASPIGFADKKSLEGKTVWDLDKQTREIVEPRYRRVLAGESFHYETNYHGRIIRTDYVPIFDERGKVALGMAIPVDVTEQRNAEEALRQSEEQFHRAVEDAPIPMIMHAEDGQVLHISRTWTELTGYTLEDMATFDSWLNRAYGEGANAVRAHVQKLFKGKQRTIDIEFPIRTSDGQTRYWSFSASSPGALRDGRRFVIGMAVDITDRKQAEEKLRDSEEQLRSVIENSLDAAYRRDLRTDRYDYMSPVFESISGFSIDEMNSMSISEVLERIHPDDRDRVSQEIDQEIDRTFKGGQSLIEYRFKDKSGRYRWLVDSINILLDSNGKPLYRVGIVRDITERKVAEIALRESRSKYRALIESTSDFIWEMDAQGRYTYCSPQMEKLWGLKPKDMIGKSPFDLMPEDSKKTALEIMTEVTKSSRPVNGLELASYDSRGNLIYLEVSAVPFFDDNGKLFGFRGISRDITERKLADEALRWNKNRAEILSEVSRRLLSSDKPQEIVNDLCRKVMDFLDCHAFFNYLIDEDNGCLHLNAYAGIPEEAAKNIERLDYGVAVCCCAARDGMRIVAENIPDTPDPRTDLVKSFGMKAYACHPLMSDGKVIGTLSFGTRSRNKFSDEDLAMMKAVADQVAIAMTRVRSEEALRKARDELELRVQERTADLSKAKDELEVANDQLQAELEQHQKLEAELIKAKDQAMEAVQAKAAFMANMSHELRTPMNSILGFTDLLLDEPLSAEYKDWLETMSMNGKALLALINDVLDFSKMEKDNIELENHPFNLRQRIEESLDLVSTKAAEKGLDIAYVMDGNVPETIISDSARLCQVLANLLSNAVKFTDTGDVLVHVTSKPEGDFHEIHFAVQDTGIGMPQDQMSKLFQPFSQINTAPSRLTEGTGLGLAISKKLVELMGGKIWAESEEGKGSTFIFTIKANAAPDDEDTKLPVGPQLKLAKRNVLIVEDNRTMRRLLGHQTKSWGMVPLVVSFSYSANELIQNGVTPDVAIIDASMPDLNGVVLAQKIRRYRKDLPLIIMTSPGQHIPQNLSAINLPKPIKPMQLYDALTSLLEGRPILEQYQAPAENQISTSALRILLAEDNVSSQQVSMGMLKKLGYKADVAANGLEVIQALERQPYDVVLMDVKMPEMDGLEATRIIRQRWPDNGPKIIAITAYALEGDREKCLEAGMNDYISKPVQKEDLARVLSKYQSSNDSS